MTDVPQCTDKSDIPRYRWEQRSNDGSGLGKRVGCGAVVCSVVAGAVRRNSIATNSVRLFP